MNSSKSASVIQSFEYILENIANVEGVKDLIEEYSFFDFRPIEYMIQNVGQEKDRQLLEKYKEDLEHYMYVKRKVFECPCEIRTPEVEQKVNVCIQEVEQRANIRVQEAEQKCCDAEQRRTAVENRLHEVEQRARESERRARQAEASVQQSQQEYHWLVQRREIELTEVAMGR